MMKTMRIDSTLSSEIVLRILSGASPERAILLGFLRYVTMNCAAEGAVSDTFRETRGECSDFLLRHAKLDVAE